MAIQNSVRALDGYKKVKGRHCISISLGESLINRYPYFIENDFDESMFFGLDCGIDLVYHKMGPDKYPPYFVGGRYYDWVKDFSRITGIRYTRHTTEDEEAAWLALKAELDKGIPVMIEVDKFEIDHWNRVVGYMDVGGHLIVAVAYDENGVYISDDCPFDPAPFHYITHEELRSSRNSKMYWNPPQNAWYSFELPERMPSLQDMVKTAIASNAERYLNRSELGTINTGIEGLRRLKDEIGGWDKELDFKIKSTRSGKAMDALSYQMMIMSKTIHTGGAGGGGNFRILYSRFLNRAASILNDDRLLQASETLLQSAQCWERMSNLIDENQNSIAENWGSMSKVFTGLLEHIIAIEGDVFRKLVQFTS
ncbi:DUF4872 domain-containing protein [Paenibacillus thailandensis]|uniref:DUF4872 domain-containing protein n=1 Tax=Paenibacillus thailandensis TaxID=393250 RepID=A0ABW5R3W1_9BACL